MISARRRPLTLLAVPVLFAVLLVGCSSESAPVVIEETDGQALFERRAIGNQAGCVTCHSLEPGVRLVGPSLADVEASAAAAGFDDTRAYVRQSIVDPEAYTVPGYDDAKSMPTTFAEMLDEQQIEAIIDYLTGLPS